MHPYLTTRTQGKIT